MRSSPFALSFFLSFFAFVCLYFDVQLCFPLDHSFSCFQLHSASVTVGPRKGWGQKYCLIYTAVRSLVLQHCAANRKQWDQPLAEHKYLTLHCAVWHQKRRICSPETPKFFVVLKDMHIPQRSANTPRKATVLEKNCKLIFPMSSVTEVKAHGLWNRLINYICVRETEHIVRRSKFILILG